MTLSHVSPTSQSERLQNEISNLTNTTDVSENLMSTESIDINEFNPKLQSMTPTQIVEWAFSNTSNPIITTNFRPQTSAILHIVSQVIPDIPVLWVDTGYNTDPTLEYAKKLTDLLNLNLHIFHPEDTEELDVFKKSGIPMVDDPRHERFTEVVKLEPFTKALNSFNPDAWISGIRKDQTEFRGSLNVLSHSKTGLLKVAPLFYWNKEQQLEYISKHGLPDENRYFDPTKVSDNRECGVQLL